MQARKNLKLSVNTKALEEAPFQHMDIEDKDHWGLSCSNTQSSGSFADSPDTGRAISVFDLGNLLDDALGEEESELKLELIPIE